ncbi:MAG: YebC/PmpR family DNA-binding transcriptional regulator [Gammaproteobacteria bacterium]|nr:MAG: YebC/PmpR family DNA-binding transcriptional regulator [Gammaproteobacteria bacterium]
MAGHSKWANIKHRKAAQDKKRGKIFTKHIREITVASRMGGPDADSNPRLRLAVDKALSVNMPKDTITRAIKKGAGIDDGVIYEEVRYEGYGPGGIAVMVDCMTDNRNRTVAEVRHAFTKYGGNLGTDGSVAYMFNEVGILSYEKGVDEDSVMEAAIEAGATDVVTNDDGSIDVFTERENFVDVKEEMIKQGYTPADSEVTQKADNEIEIDLEKATSMLKMLDTLEDLDDVQGVFSNADISEEVLEQLNK